MEDYGTGNATHEGCSPSDQLERPVRVLASGFRAYVIAADNAAGTITVQDTRQFLDPRLGWERLNEPVTLLLEETQPLCIHCIEPLAPSDFEAPGSCHNASCWLGCEPPPGCSCWHCVMEREELRALAGASAAKKRAAKPARSSRFDTI